MMQAIAQTGVEATKEAILPVREIESTGKHM